MSLVELDGTCAVEEESSYYSEECPEEAGANQDEPKQADEEEEEEGIAEEPEEGSKQGAAEEDQMEESSEDDQPPVPELIGGRFKVKRKIGSGSYSEVYLGIDTATLDKVAIKAEWKGAEKTDKLHGEVMLYQKLGRSNAVPAIHWFGVEGEYSLMVMDLLGPSLDSLLKEYKRFSLRTTLLLANQMLERLEYVHDRGIVYRDIKPHNFLLGRGETKDHVYIVDFGLSKRYWSSKHGKHIRMRKHIGHVGTVRYSSLKQMQGYEASRRDDLEALGYVLMHFLRGTLPWQGIKAKNRRKKHALIQLKKVEATNGADCELCRGHPQEFADYLRYCRDLDFEERPDYTMLRGKFRCLYIAQGFDAAGWEPQFDDVLEAPSNSGRTEKETAEAEERSRSGRRRKTGPQRQSCNGRLAEDQPATEFCSESHNNT
eukprot:CAMPEP_0178412458 /NCGR_PEP_ID=MMETSP0689_2-20121128/22026_1 /TAXON_ID=160604 /ORGANISM="Amphidinium massartii, Strain CS-259" /LENGTH=428 /DNA_ID=CAMNT_0020033707 /DNA_START=76 /DNA_END=1359 /DNA_ORIENTATION=+